MTDLRVVVFVEHDIWVAVGLEHAIVAQGETQEIALRRFAIALNSECVEEEGRSGLSAIRPAPKRFHRMWNDASRYVDTKLSELNCANLELTLSLKEAA